LDTTEAQFRDAMTLIVQHQMIAMPMMWDSNITGGTSPDAVFGAVDLWTGIHLPVLTDPAFEKYILLNIANEWGGDNNTWRDTYVEAVVELRDAGIRVPIVIDALDWGHDVEVFGGGRGAAVLAADELGYVIFSTHGYYEWSTAQEVANNFATMDSYGFAWLLGEFGADDHLAGGKTTDHWTIMQLADDEGIGWMAWSWKGNGSSEIMLDMNNTYNTLSLTERGEEIVNSDYGLMNTSSRASYWPDF
jgi:mannan endo-1,4-beta-mannosidase